MPERTAAGIARALLRALGVEDDIKGKNIADAVAALRSYADQVREECARIAETENVSTVELARDGVAFRKGPFTIQDEATATCAASIASAIRQRIHDEGKG